VAFVLPRAVTERMLADLRAVEQAVRQGVRGVEELPDPADSMSFVDGSFVLEERRGCSIVLLSVYAATASHEGIRLLEGAVGSERPLLVPIVPREGARGRASALMKLLEVTAAYRALLDHEPQAVVLDGAYPSFVYPATAARVMYERLRRTLFSFDRKLGEAVCGWLTKQLTAAVSALSLNATRPFDAVGELLTTEYAFLDQMLNEVAERMPSEAEAALPVLINFAAMAFEDSAALRMLRCLLETAEERGVCICWVAKDADSRYLFVETGGGVRRPVWVTDVALLDAAWRDFSFAYADAERLGGRLGALQNPGRGAFLYHTYPRRIFEDFLTDCKGGERWCKYPVYYTKLSLRGPVLQLTTPICFASGIERVIAALRLWVESERGYPSPLVRVHHGAALSENAARLLGIHLYQRCEEQVLKAVLAPTGRYVGL